MTQSREQVGTLRPLACGQISSWGFRLVMVLLTTLPPKTASWQGHSSLGGLRGLAPMAFEVWAVVSSLEKQNRLQEKQMRQLRAQPIAEAQAARALIFQGMSGWCCWGGRVRPNYTLLRDRRCQKIKGINPSGSPAAPPPRARAAA